MSVKRMIVGGNGQCRIRWLGWTAFSIMSVVLCRWLAFLGVGSYRGWCFVLSSIEREVVGVHVICVAVVIHM